MTEIQKEQERIFELCKERLDEFNRINIRPGIFPMDYTAHIIQRIKEGAELKSVYLPIQWSQAWELRHHTSAISKIYFEQLQEIFDSCSDAFNYFSSAVTRNMDQSPFIKHPKNFFLYCGGGYNSCDVDHTPEHSIIPLVHVRELRHYQMASLSDIKRTLILYCLGGESPHWVRLKSNEFSKCCDFVKWTEKLRYTDYLEELRNASFALCPRGCGPTTYRIYEALAAGTIPIYITDQPIFPYEDEVDWKNLVIVVTPDKLAEIPKIVTSISEEECFAWRRRMKQFCEKYLTLERICSKILQQELKRICQ